MHYWIRFIVLTAMTLFFADLCNISESAAEGQKVALVIGNAAYKSAPLKNPVNDARDMAEALEKMGFEVLHEENASRRAMKDAIHRFGQKLKKGGVGLFYFAGHGMQVDGRNFLIPVNADIQAESDIEFESVDAARILAKMEDAGNNMNLIILDSCRDNPFARSFRSSSRGLARMDAPHGSFIAYATAPGQTAADGSGRNGIFTESLLRHMATPNLKIEDVLKRVRVEVAGKTVQKQVPWQSSSLMGDFYFVQRSGAAPVASVTPNLPQSSSPSLDQFLEESEARRLETEKWDQWQKSRESDYEKILKIDKEPYLTKERKKEAWKIFLASISQDNPYSYKDDEMRDYSRSRFEYWQNYRDEPQNGKLYVQTFPAEAMVRILNIGPRFRQGMELDPGRYHVEASADGYETRKEWISLGSGEEKKLEYRLEKSRETVSLLGESPQNYASLDPAVTRAKIVKRDRHFEKYDTGVVKDAKTGLEWYAGPNKDTDWNEAKMWVDGLSVDGGGWRMPTRSELKRLYEKGKGSRNMTPLLETTGWWVWSGEKEGSSGAWGHYFYYGGDENWGNRGYRSNKRAFAVRSR